jgi:hypothetical protein
MRGVPDRFRRRPRVAETEETARSGRAARGPCAAAGDCVRTVPVVKLTVSGGARVRVVPNVVGRTEADAGRILRAASFVARPIDRAVTPRTLVCAGAPE